MKLNSGNLIAILGHELNFSRNAIRRLNPLLFDNDVQLSFQAAHGLPQPAHPKDLGEVENEYDTYDITDFMIHDFQPNSAITSSKPQT